jgi:hypothetical protein
VAHASAGRGESGISLIEIVMSLGILSGVLISLGALIFQVAKYSQRSAMAGYKSAAVSSAAAWAQTVPWDSMNAALGCANDSTGKLQYVRCTTVDAVSPQARTVRIVITPQTADAGRPDTVAITRNKPRRSYSPLKVQ